MCQSPLHREGGGGSDKRGVCVRTALMLPWSSPSIKNWVGGSKGACGSPLALVKGESWMHREVLHRQKKYWKGAFCCASRVGRCL